jgi:hypothetical protein
MTISGDVTDAEAVDRKRPSEAAQPQKKHRNAFTNTETTVSPDGRCPTA